MQGRRTFLTAMAASLPLAAAAAPGTGTSPPAAKKKLKIVLKSAWGSDDPTKAVFAFSHGVALAEAGHDVTIFPLGEGVNLMRASVASSVVPVGWPPLSEFLHKAVKNHIQIYSCGLCSKARGITDDDLKQWNAQFGSPAILVGLVESADRIITE
jgi:predicted peroxiredoxin